MPQCSGGVPRLGLVSNWQALWSGLQVFLFSQSLWQEDAIIPILHRGRLRVRGETNALSLRPHSRRGHPEALLPHWLGEGLGEPPAEGQFSK